MKRKLIDAFERPEDSKVGRFETHVGPVHVTQHQATPTNPEPTPADIDLHNVMTNFVNIYEKLDPTDDPAFKPNYSYTELVYLAVLRSPNFCLPIGEIYKYVQNRFAFFRNNARQHWKNAIRHSLSKTKCFTKISLGRGSAGSSRSCFLWSIDPCSIINFARGDYRPNVDRDSGTNTLRWGYYHTNAGNFWDQVAIVLETKIEFFKACLLVCPSPSKLSEQQVCTLPVPQTSQLPQCSTPMTPVHQQSPVVNQPTPVQNSTPPPNVVCQPNGAFYSNSTPVTYNSSTPNVYHHYKPVLDQTPVSVHPTPVASDASPVSHYVKVNCDEEIFYEPSVNTYHAASPNPNGSCTQSPSSQPACVTPRWSPVCISNDSSIGKDSGIELSSADLESIREVIIQQYHSSPVESKLFEACGSHVDLNTSSYQSNDSGHEASDELPVFPAYVADDQPLDLSVIPHMTTSSNATNAPSYQPYSFSQTPQYNFTRFDSSQVYAFDTSKTNVSAYQPVQWFQ